MSQVVDEEKTVVVELLECWKLHDCLWDPEHEGYSNRDRRNEAYNSLLNIYKKLRADATIGELKKKMENMRTAYKREVRKVLASDTSSGFEHIYKPKLWYFDLMTFLDDKAGAETLEQDSQKDNPVTVKVEPDLDIEPDIDVEPDEADVNIELDIGEAFSLTDSQTAPSHRLKRVRTSLEKEKKGLIKTAKALLTSKEDKWEVIGRSLGLQLKDLSAHQQAIALKLMADVIFLGTRGRLTDDASINLKAQHFVVIPK